MTSIRDKILGNAYTTSLPLVPRPREPRMPNLAGTPVAEQIKALDTQKDALLAYGSELSEWEKRYAAHHADQMRLNAEFKKDLYEALEITNHPKRETLYNKAYDRGSSKLGILEAALDLVELM